VTINLILISVIWAKAFILQGIYSDLIMPLPLTEEESKYKDLELMGPADIIRAINEEDNGVAEAVAMALPQVEKLIARVIEVFNKGGRLFYIGAGTSGRLGILDASECVPTFGVPPGMVIGIIAGGDSAIRTAVEGAEDDIEQGIKDLEVYAINNHDITVGIAASGRTPYVVHALKNCRERGIPTACIVCSPESLVAAQSDYPIEVLTGPEFVTGSTRMKAGTAQKMVLNMITTAAMIKMGRIEGNKMTHMAVTNSKLEDRAVRIVMEKTGLGSEESKTLLAMYGNDIAITLGKWADNSL
jgi:N-acetylmuramic acid 6-phosphate etherase